MTEIIHHVTLGKVKGSTYIILSSGKTPVVTSLRYRQSDSVIDKMFRKRKTCTVPFGSYVQSPWTKWMKEKGENT